MEEAIKLVPCPSFLQVGFVIASSCKDITVLATKHHGMDSAVQSIRSSDASAQRGTKPVLRQMTFLLELLQHVC